MKQTGRILLSVLVIAAMLLTCVITAIAERTPAAVGDADGDGSVSIFDATAIQRWLAKIELSVFVEEAADMDGDGSVSIFDATAIQRFLADLPPLETTAETSAPATAPASEPWTQGVSEAWTEPASEGVYDGWIDKSRAEKIDGYFTQDLEILEIHPDYFIAAPYIPLPFEVRINGSISDHWCVGDHVFVVCDNVWYQESSEMFPYRYEGDLVSIEESTFVPDPSVAYKPVIYLYPETETEVSVSLDLDGALLISEPLYRDGWTVTASPDGTLTDKDGRQYGYLFWEAKLNADYDMSKGFCVKGGDTEAFLSDALKKLGLNEREAKDFMEFWLPIMEKNPYNVIAFQTDAYTDAAGLNVSPQPDSVIRVFMTYYASDSAVAIPAQELTAPDRSGFTVVEWGGSMVVA